MAGMELATLNTKAGAGINTTKLKQDGEEQELEIRGAAASGDLTLGLTAKKEDKPSRAKAGFDLAAAKFDAIFNQESDKYMRFALNLGPTYHRDVTTFSQVRVAWQIGVNGRWEYTNLKVKETNVSGGNRSVAFPLAFGLGTSHIFLQDQAELMIELTPSFKVKNTASGSWRIYANLNNLFLQTIDVTLSHTYESGKLASGIEEKSTLVMAGLSLGLFNYSIK